jgi:hypothetical protein
MKLTTFSLIDICSLAQSLNESNPSDATIAFSLSLSADYRLVMRVYPKVSGLAAWRENWEWYSSLPLGAVVSLFCESV